MIVFPCPVPYIYKLCPIRSGRCSVMLHLALAPEIRRWPRTTDTAKRQRQTTAPTHYYGLRSNTTNPLRHSAHSTPSATSLQQPWQQPYARASHPSYLTHLASPHSDGSPRSVSPGGNDEKRRRGEEKREKRKEKRDKERGVFILTTAPATLSRLFSMLSRASIRHTDPRFLIV